MLVGAVVVVLLVGGIALFKDDPEPAPPAAVSVPTTTPAWTASATSTTTASTTATTTSTSSAATSTTVPGRAETKELCDEIDAADDRRIPMTDSLYDHLHGANGWTWASAKPYASRAATALDTESTTLLTAIRRSDAPTVVTSAATDYADGLGDWAESLRSDLAARSSEGFTRTNALKPHLRELAEELARQCKETE
ncbi:hypothetical protein KFZ73_16230 [Tsukamurella paurometabola]|uniref:Uncharacterized protein n=1 Tax=Tsukamurella paurometabola TaxID=2061 RepID=A0ABS5NEQ8_TSUPA|nr:hypothetical protein [Tsukamurella paurometabola]